MKLNISLEEWHLLTESVNETIAFEIKEQKCGFIGMFLCILSYYV